MEEDSKNSGKELASDSEQILEDETKGNSNKKRLKWIFSKTSIVIAFFAATVVFISNIDTLLTIFQKYFSNKQLEISVLGGKRTYTISKDEQLKIEYIFRNIEPTHKLKKSNIKQIKICNILFII